MECSGGSRYGFEIHRSYLMKQLLQARQYIIPESKFIKRNLTLNVGHFEMKILHRKSVEFSDKMWKENAIYFYRIVGNRVTLFWEISYLPVDRQRTKARSSAIY